MIQSISWQSQHRHKKGFTLVELLVVIAIIISLSAVVFAVVRRAMLSAQKTATANTMRSLETGLNAFQVEYNKPPVPDSVIAAGQDVVLGNMGGNNSNAYLVAVLEGLPTEQTNLSFNFGGEPWNVEQVNKKMEAYTTFTRVSAKKNGAFDRIGDRSFLELFDAWGNTIMVGLNVPPYQTEFQDGLRDSRCFTNQLADYTDTAPRDENFVIWSYGKDRVKGTTVNGRANNRFASSDDVKSW